MVLNLFVKQELFLHVSWDPRVNSWTDDRELTSVHRVPYRIISDINIRMSSKSLQLNCKRKTKKTIVCVISILECMSEAFPFLCVCVPLVQQVFSKIILSHFYNTDKDHCHLTPVKYRLKFHYLPCAGQAAGTRRREKRQRCSILTGCCHRYS